MESIQDRITVGPGWGQTHRVMVRCEEGDRIVGSFPTEDDAWGVAWLVVEYAERHGYGESEAIYAALGEWCDAAELANLAPDVEEQDAAYQDHCAEMMVA